MVVNFSVHPIRQAYDEQKNLNVVT